MQSEWDPAKSRTNIGKHGIDLSDAVAVFEDTVALTRPDTGVSGERRFVTLGQDGFGRLLVVVFVERDSRIRVVSARVATKQERKSYEA